MVARYYTLNSNPQIKEKAPEGSPVGEFSRASGSLSDLSPVLVAAALAGGFS
jgi:hypothetical protein